MKFKILFLTLLSFPLFSSFNYKVPNMVEMREIEERRLVAKDRNERHVRQRENEKIICDILNKKPGTDSRYNKVIAEGLALEIEIKSLTPKKIDFEKMIKNYLDKMR